MLERKRCRIYVVEIIVAKKKIVSATGKMFNHRPVLGSCQAQRRSRVLKLH